MRTIQTTVYTYAELSDKAKAKACDWFRQFPDIFSGEFTVEDAKTCFALCGLTVKRVFWSGFSSQGDGACFEGSWSASDVKPGALKEHAPKDEELHRIAAGFESIAAQFPGASFSVKHSGHYRHEFCTEFDARIEDAEGNAPKDESAANTAEKTLIELARDAMRWTYRALESEYNYQTADEQVAETIVANGYEFTAEGERAG